MDASHLIYRISYGDDDARYLLDQVSCKGRNSRHLLRCDFTTTASCPQDSQVTISCGKWIWMNAFEISVYISLCQINFTKILRCRVLFKLQVSYMWIILTQTKNIYTLESFILPSLLQLLHNSLWMLSTLNYKRRLCTINWTFILV